MSDFNEIQWAVQRNLSGEESVKAMQIACELTGVDCILFEIVPFSTVLPKMPNGKRTIYYGSTTTMYLAYSDERFKEGVFFDENQFSIKNYVSKWGEYMLNYGAHFLSIKDVAMLDCSPEQLLFIRPNEDSKSFSGTVMKFAEVAGWLEEVQRTESFALTPDTEIVIAEPYQIESEWRLWIVEGKVVSASKYRQNFRLQKERGCPPEVLEFAEARCREYVPHQIFVMDIGLCGGQHYIIECGCMNSSGFYDADINAIIKNVTLLFQKIIKANCT